MAISLCLQIHIMRPSGALTGCFAIAGALTGAIAGALAAKATKSGFLRGVSLGAIAGAILSVEVLEASRAYWCMEQNWFTGGIIYGRFIEELVRGRLVEESLAPAILTAYNLQFEQVGIANTGYDEFHDVHGLVASRGLSGESLKKLPHHMIMKAENTCCAIVCREEQLQVVTASQAT
ncbi:NEP1-interacting protein-like 2 [Sesbania bispinosa]|nr:NEP1-interacting protein-like 2 [Sesbania bispinosa]